jgi:hypothetical protein
MDAPSQETNMKILTGILFAIIGFTAFAIASHFDYEEAELNHHEYCESVRAWNNSNGSMGHPDYDGIAKRGFCVE